MSKGERNRTKRREMRERIEAGEVPQDMAPGLPLRSPNRYRNRSRYVPQAVAAKKREAEG